MLQTIKTAGLRLNKSKLPQVEYLEHVIDESGLHPTQEKVKAIQDAPEPKNLMELCSFLGMINYYNLFFAKFVTTGGTIIPTAQTRNTLALEIKTV